MLKHDCDLSQLNFFHKRKQHILRIRNIEGHSFFESYVSRWKVKRLIFLPLLRPPFFCPPPPQLIVAVELTRVDSLLSQTRHASIQLCYLLAALPVQGKLLNLFFYSTSFLLCSHRAWAWLLTFSWTAYKKIRVIPALLAIEISYLLLCFRRLICVFSVSHLPSVKTLQTSYSLCCMNEWRK